MIPSPQAEQLTVALERALRSCDEHDNLDAAADSIREALRIAEALAARDPQAVGRPNFDSFRQQVVNALPAHMNDVVEVGVAMEAIDMAAPLLAARDPRLPQPKGGDDPDALRMHKRQPLPDPRASATTGDRLEPAGDPRLPSQEVDSVDIQEDETAGGFVGRYTVRSAGRTPQEAVEAIKSAIRLLSMTPWCLNCGPAANPTRPPRENNDETSGGD